MVDKTLNFGRRHIRRFLGNARPYDQVLDIGAGKGLDLESARYWQPLASLHAVEIHRPYVRQLRKAGVKVHALDLEHDILPFCDEQFDIIIANQVMEHVKEVFWIFHELSRVLKTGGKLIIGVPNLASLHNRLLLLVGRQPSCLQNASAHVRGWTRHDLLQTLEQCYPGGYTVKAGGGGNFYPFPPLAANLLAAVLPNMAWSVLLMLEKTAPYESQFMTYLETHRLQTNFYQGKQDQPEEETELIRIGETDND